MTEPLSGYSIRGTIDNQSRSHPEIQPTQQEALAIAATAAQSARDFNKPRANNLEITLNAAAIIIDAEAAARQQAYLAKLSPQVRAMEVARQLPPAQTGYEKQLLAKNEADEVTRKITHALASFTLEALQNPQIIPTFFDQKVTRVDCHIMQEPPEGSNKPIKTVDIRRTTPDSGKTYDTRITYTDHHGKKIEFEDIAGQVTIREGAHEGLVTVTNPTERSKALGKLTDELDTLLPNAVVQHRALSRITHYQPMPKVEEREYVNPNNTHPPQADSRISLPYKPPPNSSPMSQPLKSTQG